MIEVFDKKAIISGQDVEYYEYKTKPIVRGYHRRPRKKKEEQKEKPKQTEKTESAVNRTRTEIRRRVNANPHLTKFLTLTTTKTNIEETNPIFNRFTQRMKYRFPEFQYFAVPEFQKDVDFFGKVKPNRGAVHYHLLCNLRFVDAKEIALDIWKQGTIDIKRIDRASNLGRYMSKYLRKDMFDERLFGKRKFFYSQDLEKPLELLQEKASLFMEATQKDCLLIMKKTFLSEYTGEVWYKLFHLNDTNA